MNGIYIIGEIIAKEISKYTGKDKKEYNNYELTILDGKYTRNIRTREDIYQKLDKGQKYYLPIGIKTFLYGQSKDQIGISYFIRKGEILNSEAEVIEIIEKTEK